jgi:hypothetical protein
MSGASRTSDCGRNGKAGRAGTGETSGTGGRQDGRTWETATTKKINKCVR